MFEGKVLVWLLAFAFIVGAAGFVLHTNEIDTLNRELNEVKSSMESIDNLTKLKKQTLVQKETENATARRDIMALEEIDTQIAKALEDRDAATTKLEMLEAAPEKLAAQLDDVTQTVRKRAIGQELGELKMQNGNVLQQARIQKITDRDITVSHAEGVMKLTAKAAPHEMISRFRIKTEAELAAIAQEKAAVLAAAAPAGSTPPVPVYGVSVEAPDPGTAPPEPDNAAVQAAIAKMRELDNRMGDLRVQIHLANQNKNSWLQQASDYRSLHARAQAMGRASSHLIKANDANSRANAIQGQIDAGNVLMEKLRQQRDEAMAKSH